MGCNALVLMLIPASGQESGAGFYAPLPIIYALQFTPQCPVMP
jgi:hypothetical protein